MIGAFAKIQFYTQNQLKEFDQKTNRLLIVQKTKTLVEFALGIYTLVCTLKVLRRVYISNCNIPNVILFK